MQNDGDGSFRELCKAQESPVQDISPVAGDDPAVLLYSSGTTGKPERYSLESQEYCNECSAVKPCLQFSEDDVLLHALPMFHAHGLFISLGCVLTTGSRMIYQAAFDPGKVVETLADASVMMGVPTFYTRLLNHGEINVENCRHIRMFVSGSAPLRKDTFNEFKVRTGHAIVERYGMSETIIQTTNPVDGERKAGTVGLPLPGVELRIVNANDEPLPTK